MASFAEKELGLDPSKYTKKKWNPYDFKMEAGKGVEKPAPPQAVDLAEMFKGAASDQDIKKMNPWSSVESVNIPMGTVTDNNNQLYADRVDADRNFPDMKDFIDQAYGDAQNATWGDEKGGEPVPVDMQADLFNDWIEEELLKKQGKIWQK